MRHLIAFILLITIASAGIAQAQDPFDLPLDAEFVNKDPLNSDGTGSFTFQYPRAWLPVEAQGVGIALGNRAEVFNGEFGEGDLLVIFVPNVPTSFLFFGMTNYTADQSLEEYAQKLMSLQPAARNISPAHELEIEGFEALVIAYTQPAQAAPYNLYVMQDDFNPPFAVVVQGLPTTLEQSRGFLQKLFATVVFDSYGRPSPTDFEAFLNSIRKSPEAIKLGNTLTVGFSEDELAAPLVIDVTAGQPIYIEAMHTDEKLPPPAFALFDEQEIFVDAVYGLLHFRDEEFEGAYAKMVFTPQTSGRYTLLAFTTDNERGKDQGLPGKFLLMVRDITLLEAGSQTDFELALGDKKIFIIPPHSSISLGTGNPVDGLLIVQEEVPLKGEKSVVDADRSDESDVAATGIIYSNEEDYPYLIIISIELDPNFLNTPTDTMLPLTALVRGA